MVSDVIIVLDKLIILMMNIVCRLLSGGLLAFIADQPLPNTLNDIINTIQIPVISTSIITTNTSTDTNSTIISIAPSEEQLANALSTLIIYNSWTEVVLLTWQDSGMQLSQLMMIHQTSARMDPLNLTILNLLYIQQYNMRKYTTFKIKEVMHIHAQRAKKS